MEWARKKRLHHVVSYRPGQVTRWLDDLIWKSRKQGEYLQSLYLLASWRWSLSYQWMPSGGGALHKVTGEGSLERKIHVIHWRWVTGKWEATAGDLLQSWGWDLEFGGEEAEMKNLLLASLYPGWRVLHKRNTLHSEIFNFYIPFYFLAYKLSPVCIISLLLLPVSCSLFWSHTV